MNELTQKIKTEFIRLDAFLKLTGLVSTGGQAKTYIQQEHVLVNGGICTQRGKKLYDGDTVKTDDNETSYRVLSEFSDSKTM